MCDEDFNVTRNLPGDILARLDLVVFERLSGGAFLPLASAQLPAWIARWPVESAEAEPVTIAQAFPFLERFLVDAEEVWQKPGAGRLRSEPFTATDPAGREMALVATAIAIGTRHFLILELLFDFEERRQTLQRAREQALEHEAHVRRTGALLPDVETVQQLVQQLTDSGLTPDQQRLAADVREGLASLAASIERLAPLPKGVSRERSRR